MSYIKHLEARFKEGKRDEGTKKVVDFYDGLIGKAKGFKGFIMSGSLGDPQKTVNISLWETKEDMDDFYANDKNYASFLESIKPLFDHEVNIETIIGQPRYTIFKLNMGK
jgi:heme-degrading monooxygenase HmoA